MNDAIDTKDYIVSNGYTDQEFTKWVNLSVGIDASWREDKRYRRHKDGVLYYIGGEDGLYIRIANDGLIKAGRYEFASPGIEEAVLVCSVLKQCESYEQAILFASQVAGQKLTNDLYGDKSREKPSVLEQIRGAAKTPSAPRKQKGARDKPEL